VPRVAFDPATGDPSEWEGAVHALIVREVGELDGAAIWPLHPILDYEVQHPWCCEQADRGGYLDWNCDVAWHINESDLAFSLKYSGTPVTEPGFYLIQGWGRKSYYHDYGAYEYDGSIGVIAGPAPISCELSDPRGTTGEGNIT
jgi:hypothetical protein